MHLRPTDSANRGGGASGGADTENGAGGRIGVLRARADQLACPRAPESDRVVLDVVTFQVGGEAYGVRSEYVREVCRVSGIAPVPCTPAFVSGICNIRGRIVSALNLRGILGLRESETPGRAWLVILQSGQMTFGILADAPPDSAHIPADEVQPGLPTLSGRPAEHLLGVTGDGMALLDGERLLSCGDLVVHDEVDP